MTIDKNLSYMWVLSSSAKRPSKLLPVTQPAALLLSARTKLKITICHRDRAVLSHGYEVMLVSNFRGLRQTHETGGQREEKAAIRQRSR